MPRELPEFTVDTLLSGLDTRFFDLSDVIAFADARLAEIALDADELEWLAEASMARSRGTLIGELWTERREVGSERRGECGWTDAAIGFLRLRYARGDLGLASVLERVAWHLDGAEHEQLECETFDGMAGQLALGADPERVRDWFEDITEPQRYAVRAEIEAIGLSGCE